MKFNIFSQSLLVSLLALSISHVSASESNIYDFHPELKSFSQNSTDIPKGYSSDYQDGTHYESYVVNAKSNDWRDAYNREIKDLPANLVAAVKPNKNISFNYHTDGSGEYWLNYKFYSDRPEVWYQVKNLKNGQVLQEGWSTVQMRKRHVVYIDSRMNERWYTDTSDEKIEVDQIEFKFDVDFHPNTKMKNFVFFRLEGATILKPARNRGYIGEYWDYNKFRSDFTAMAGHR